MGEVVAGLGPSVVNHAEIAVQKDAPRGRSSQDARVRCGWIGAGELASHFVRRCFEVHGDVLDLGFVHGDQRMAATICTGSAVHLLFDFSSQNLEGCVSRTPGGEVTPECNVLLLHRGSAAENFSQVGNHAPRIRPHSPVAQCGSGNSNRKGRRNLERSRRLFSQVCVQRIVLFVRRTVFVHQHFAAKQALTSSLCAQSRRRSNSEFIPNRTSDASRTPG